jgi:flagellar hook-associated protein 2
MSTISSTSGTSSTYSSRVTGMFSGLDTDALVEGMTSTQQSRVDAAKQKQTYTKWQSEALSTVEDEVTTFLNEYCSPTGSNSMLKATSYYNYEITSDSESSAVTLTASSSALTGTYSVAVTQLAENANVSSSTTDGDGISGSGGEISSSNSATLGSLSFENSLFNGGDKISFSINGKTFSFNKDTTLQNMINTINNDSDANVTMKYSRLTDSFTITADSGGADSKVVIDNITGNAFGDNSAFQIKEGTYQNGKDSISVINGIPVTKDSNEFSIDGVKFKLNAVTNKDDTGNITSDELINFTVERDYTATTDAITNFVEKFNELLTKLDSLVNEKDYSDDYPPLTDAQKEDMTEEQIKAWETKAKSGLLRNNSDLEYVITNLKNAFYSSLGGTGKNTTSIGISTASYFDENAGLFVVDSEKLTEALKNNPEEVVSMFTNGSSSSTSEQMGLMYKLRVAMTNYNKKIEDSQEIAEDKIDAYDDDISELEDKLDKLAERYYEQFSRMETALASLNSQASYISQLFST